MVGGNSAAPEANARTIGRRGGLRALAVACSVVALGSVAQPAAAQTQRHSPAHGPVHAISSPVAILYQADKRSVARYLRHAPRRGEYIFSESAPIDPPASGAVSQKEIVDAIDAAKAKGLPKHLQVKYAPAFNLWSGGQITVDDVDQFGNPVVVTLAWTGRVVKVLNQQGQDVTATSHIKDAQQKSFALLPVMAKAWRDAYAANGLHPDYFALNETPSHLGYRRDLQRRLAVLLKNLYRPDTTYKPLPGILYVQRSSVAGFPRGGSAASQAFRLAVADTTSFVVAENWVPGKKVLRSATHRLVHAQYALYNWLRERAPKLAHRFVVMDSSYRGYGTSLWEGCPRRPYRHHRHHTRHKLRQNPAAYMDNRQADAYVDKIFQVVAQRPHWAPRAVAFGPVAEQARDPLSSAAMNARIRARLDHQLFR